ncbi:hypothetical protein NP233_g9349 [Leucocoprinus birnbaumii]|uniref:NADH dehydrogenase [ubiquinone] 1 beta subcomplex subunit 7 n=1 Tax=Leucocoprinus birnbaumii TaxID=56174 RepID=A0AAD5VN16_9AGAR|nr:hypothetical protein NP233_g9349 [Leucocoprinus birnbaumii]
MERLLGTTKPPTHILHIVNLRNVLYENKQPGIRLLLPLNVCRKKNYYLPWECEHERHEYERCQYDDYVRRMKKLAKEKAEAAEE